MKMFVVGWVMFWLTIAGGWAMNIVKLCKCDFQAPYKTEVIRVISIVPVIGAVTGWMDIGEENK